MLTLRSRVWTPEHTSNGIITARMYYADGRILYSSDSASLPQKTVERSMQGYDVDNFRARKKRGELLPYTQYERIDEVRECLGISFSRTWPNGVYGSHHQTGGTLPPSMKQEALNFASSFDGQRYLHKAAEQLAAHWDSLTFAAEIGSLIRSYATYARRLLSLRDPATLGDMWLDARYHWRPLILDFFSLRDSAIQLLKQRDRFTHSAGTTFDREIVTSLSLSDNPVTIKDTTTTSFKIGIRGSITCDYERPPYQLNPLVTTWELVPYSFIMDQIIDIGGLLRTLLFINNVRALSSAVGYKISASRLTSRGVVYCPSGYTYTITQNKMIKQTCEIILRTPSNINPTLQSGLLGNVYHLVDVLALAVRFITAKKNREPDARNLAYT